MGIGGIKSLEPLLPRASGQLSFRYVSLGIRGDRRKKWPCFLRFSSNFDRFCVI